MIRAAVRVGVVLLLALAAGCVSVSPRGAPGPLHLSEILDEGDAARRASQRLVMDGLSADVQASPRRAVGYYERALGIDPTNPFAYLALARHYVEAGEYQRGIEYLDQAGVLLGSPDGAAPGVEAHLDGLRGAAFVGLGRARAGEPLLERAQLLAPSVWGDANLSAAELR